RPASILKELIENSLDAGATKVIIDIHDGGKSLISIEDNGSGIELSDMDLLFERYATSKIYGEQDLFNLSSYGFRGEALASIAEVSKTTIISKTAYSEIGTKVTKLGIDPIIKHQPVGFAHGTLVTIQDLFYNVPARLKFLKSSQTEFFYCYNYIVDIALMHADKTFIFKKNDKIVFDLEPRDSLMERIMDIYKKDWSKHIKEINHQSEELSLYGIIGNAQLLFGSTENIKIYVNKRPVQDKVIRKALMDAYYRQIAPSEYPLAILMIEAKPSFVDVNVHPRKLEVKFADSRKVYDMIYSNVRNALGEQRISTISQQFSKMEISGNINPEASSMFGTQNFGNTVQANVTQATMFSPSEQEQGQNQEIGEYKVVGQLWNSYIILESADALYYIDQHALAERVLFEKIRKSFKTTDKPTSEILLQPIIIEVAVIPNLDEKLNEINTLGFDVSMIRENKIVIYAVPQIFSLYKIDMEKVFNTILYLEIITFDYILDNIFATHACKVSIKAGDRLSLPEMTNLVKDGFAGVPGLFVCQHGRPFFIKTEKKDIDKFFDR
ncbi:MAG TPA: DNA mismatch repair endonuclease MutL, partial [Candidatus Absconditabacterales bacterium]|nr:DNA mismatch repair endonuclease MutL [Candidatus Absconditabacterales bacterium]